MNRDFFVKVKNTTREGKELFGTAYPVGPDLLLTCGHVVLGKEKIEVQWQISDPKESVPDCEYVDHKSWRKIKNVPWIGDDPVDAALIRVDGMPKVAMQRPGRLQAERLPRTLPFESIGFPKAHQFE